MTPDTTALDRNLAAVRLRQPRLAEVLAATDPLTLDWSEARSGARTAAIAASTDAAAVQLASRFDPEAEAAKLVADVDHGETACVVLLGLGLGYAANHVVQATAGQGLLIAYEPDVALLRAVLERVDHSGWLVSPGTVLLAGDEVGRAELNRAVEGRAVLLTSGTRLIELPVSRRLHGEALDRFGRAMAEVTAYCRTHVATALVNTSRTHGNLLSNLAMYAAGATTDELAGAARGVPAVCVAAGPSLVRNVDLLRDPAVRERVVVIAVQTALKPLLDRGIRPDFVTALDYAQISTRFYEGLPDLPDVSLIAEPKAHPSILDRFPGPIRTTPSGFLNRMSGDTVGHDVPLKQGATVAHLSFFLAQHLGCDPIILTGQDLGFSDALYYCPGTAAWDVWSPEFNLFNTVETMEWVRIARMGASLSRHEDIHGRPIFSDEQMRTYLQQFEREFAACEEAGGPRVIDATEGGMPKAHTQRMTLAQAVAGCATADRPRLPLPARELDAQRLAAAEATLRKRQGELRRLTKTTRESAGLVREMIEHQRDRGRMNRLFDQLTANRHLVEGELKEIFELVGSLNTMGTLKRWRSDQAIRHAQQGTLEHQRRQLERDAQNLDWLGQACDEMAGMLDEAARRMGRGEAATQA